MHKLDVALGFRLYFYCGLLFESVGGSTRHDYNSRDLSHLIGRGGFANVFRATRKHEKQTFAIKVSKDKVFSLSEMENQDLSEGIMLMKNTTHLACLYNSFMQPLTPVAQVTTERSVSEILSVDHELLLGEKGGCLLVFISVILKITYTHRFEDRLGINDILAIEDINYSLAALKNY